ncbi:hypothetical protein EK904_013138 [Melospiza melodia maxima]|nr:hypothetical protein EK904_013138 [Melospiza melodia maxima]
MEAPVSPECRQGGSHVSETCSEQGVTRSEAEIARRQWNESLSTKGCSHISQYYQLSYFYYMRLAEGSVVLPHLCPDRREEWHRCHFFLRPPKPLAQSGKKPGTLTDKDQQKRDRLIQILDKYKKDLVCDLPASPVKCRSISPNQQKINRAPLENGHPLSGQSNYPRTKREQPLSVSCQKFKDSEAGSCCKEGCPKSCSKHELWSHDSEMPLSPGLQLEEVALEDVFQMHIKISLHTAAADLNSAAFELLKNSQEERSALLSPGSHEEGIAQCQELLFQRTISWDEVANDHVPNKRQTNTKSQTVAKNEPSSYWPDSRFTYNGVLCLKYKDNYNESFQQVN